MCQRHDLCSYAVNLNTDRYVQMTSITQCCKAPHTLQYCQTTHLFCKSFLTTSLSSHYITEGKKPNHNPSNVRRLHSVVTQKLISVYIREKTSTRKRNTRVGKKTYFIYLKFLMGDVEDTPFGLCQ